MKNKQEITEKHRMTLDFFNENPEDTQKPTKHWIQSNVILCFSVNSCLFFESEEKIKFVQEILQELDHK